MSEMPTYEYKCKDCGEEFECIVARSQKNKVKCEKCDSKNVDRLLSTAKFSMGSAGTGAQNLNTCTSCSSSCKTCK
jgi:putative FmdB family regulatory protein